MQCVVWVVLVQTESDNKGYYAMCDAGSPPANRDECRG